MFVQTLHKASNIWKRSKTSTSKAKESVNNKNMKWENLSYMCYQVIFLTNVIKFNERRLSKTSIIRNLEQSSLVQLGVSAVLNWLDYDVKAAIRPAHSTLMMCEWSFLLPCKYLIDSLSQSVWIIYTVYCS